MKKSTFIWVLFTLSIVAILGSSFSSVSANEAYLRQLNRYAACIFRRFIKDIERLGYVVIITSGFRTYEKQALLKKQNPLNARPGSSEHEFGNALDIVLQKNGRIINKSSSPTLWKDTGVPALAERYGLSWGGKFPNYYDPVHFYVKR